MAFKRLKKALTISTSQYAAGDVVGGLISFTAAEVAGIAEGYLLNSVTIVDDDNIKSALDLYLFDAAPTSRADNAAWSPSIDDLKKIITKVAIAANTYETLNSNGRAEVNDINNVGVSEGLLYAYLVTPTATTPTYTSTTALWLALDFVPEPRGKW